MVTLRLIFFIFSLHLKELLPCHLSYVPNSPPISPSLLRCNLLPYLLKVWLILYSLQSVTFPPKMVFFHSKKVKGNSPSPHQPRTFQETLNWYHLGALSPIQMVRLLVPWYYCLNITIAKSPTLNLEHTFWNQEYNFKKHTNLRN